MTARLLIVDDNAMYRAALRRHLMIQGYDVAEAEDGDAALERFHEARPDVVITDLSMRTATEGLDVIRALKRADPLLPIVMMSAVGTFEEGAEATRLGAHAVLSKSRIEDEMERLFKAVEGARTSGDAARALRAELDAIAKSLDTHPTADATARLRALSSDQQIAPTLRTEAFDLLARAVDGDVRRALEAEAEAASRRELDDAALALKAEVADIDRMEAETRKELATAEFLFRRQGGDKPSPTRTDFSRNVGFSYCFAVEFEAKARLRKRLTRFLSGKDTQKLIRLLLDGRTGQLNIFFHQYLARQHNLEDFDFTIDHVVQLLQRLLEHESRYKPDGLKALGIIVLIFGRDYAIKAMPTPIKVENPLGLRGLETDAEVVQLAHQLVALQHYRNPYIHPEISELEKLSKIRRTALDCLRLLARLPQ